jgi:hypothetical protein
MAMKKIVFLMMVLALLATSCKEKKSKALNYNDADPIEMVLRGNHQIDVSSDYDITYRAINNNPNVTVIEVSGSGNIYAKNVGTAKVKIDNDYEDRIVNVVVSLFRQPTFEFGCASSRIREIYGRPFESGWLPGDTILCYRYTASQGYSYACGEMDFFFYNRQYYESDVYIRPNVEYLLNNYLDENFNYHSTIGDTLDVYKYKEDTTIICGKFASHNEWNEWCLFYIQTDQNKSLANILKERPRSSKLRY